MVAKKKDWVTSADVARHAGVSRSAVSRTFTPGASVSEETRKRVEASANALGYQVNVIARAMNTGSSNLIGIVTAGFDNPFRSKLLAPLVHHLALRGFMPLLINTDDPKQLEPSLRKLLSYHIAGVILTSGAPPLSLAQEYLAKKVPVTLVNRHAELPGADVVCSDNRQGACLAAELFQQSGFSQIGFIGEEAHNFSSNQRRAFFSAAVQDMTYRECLCQTADYESGKEAAAALLNAHPDIEGLFCATDLLAMGAIDFIRSQDIFSDIKIIGFDDIPQASFDSFQLTTIRQNVDKLAEIAVDSVMNRMSHFSEPSQRQYVPVRLIRRHSA